MTLISDPSDPPVSLAIPKATAESLPLSELLRPKQLSDLTLPQRDIDRLQKMIDAGKIMNMVFYGKPGLGKTSAAHVFGMTAKVDYTAINAAEFERPTALKSIERFGSSASMFSGGYKFVLLDEADFIPAKVQASLRHLIESMSDNCRFLLTVNHINKISDALRSRLKEVCFDISPIDQGQVIERLVDRYEAKLPEMGIKFDPKRLRELVGIYFPDLRSIANQVEYEFA